MWKNIAEPNRSQTTIWRMSIACWITKGTNTHSEYVILIAFPLQKWLHERASMLRYTYTACLVLQIRLLKLVMKRGSYGYFVTNISHGFSATVNPNISAWLRR